MANDHNVDVCLLLDHSAWLKEGLALWGLWLWVEGVLGRNSVGPVTREIGDFEAQREPNRDTHTILVV